MSTASSGSLVRRRPRRAASVIWAEALILCLLGISGCARHDAAQPVARVPEPVKADEQRLWDASREVAEELISSDLRHRDGRLEEYVQRVMDRIAGPATDPGSQRPRVFLLDSPVVNAFAFPQGDVFIHTGLLGRLRNEAQLAMLLGHELTHATHRHAFEALQRAYALTTLQSYAGVLLPVAGGYLGQAASGLGTLLTIAAISGYSREQEAEADREGLARMARAGYDPREGPALFEQILAATEREPGPLALLYGSHPRLSERVASSRAALRDLNLEAAGEVGDDAYLAVAGPLIFREVRVHLAQGRFELAARTLDELQARMPADPRPFVWRGELHRMRGGPQDEPLAKTAYEKALELDPRRAEAARGLGLLALRQGDRPAAARQFQTFLDLQPESPETPWMRNLILRSAPP